MGRILTGKVRSHQLVILIIDCIHVRVQSMQILHIINNSSNEHFWEGPLSVHCREVLLYLDRCVDVGLDVWLRVCACGSCIRLAASYLYLHLPIPSRFMKKYINSINLLQMTCSTVFFFNCGYLYYRHVLKRKL